MLRRLLGQTVANRSNVPAFSIGNFTIESLGSTGQSLFANFMAFWRASSQIWFQFDIYRNTCLTVNKSSAPWFHGELPFKPIHPRCGSCRCWSLMLYASRTARRLAVHHSFRAVVMWNIMDWIATKTGWWFGTFFIFPYIGFLIIPIDFHIFQRGGPTTNQKAFVHE